MWLLACGSYRFGCSLAMWMWTWLLIGDVVAHWRCGCTLDMLLLIGYVVARWRCGCLLEMWLLAEDAVAR